MALQKPGLLEAELVLDRREVHQRVRQNALGPAGEGLLCRGLDVLVKLLLVNPASRRRSRRNSSFSRRASQPS
eukprot:s644_g32.t1